MNDPIPSAVRSFVLHYIGSVEMLEALLLVFGQPLRQWTAEELGREARTNEWSAQLQLQELSDRGPIFGIGERPRQYQANPAFGAIVEELERTFRRSRVALVSLIYSAPVGR
jgi:hypothetical protein